eukprot:TRINITY_DN19223_c0_g2_i5.p1 TRINITY_DN19223_c0_g2~~TRINITY_DN19223_c0_g2_i5.p1  ORF type:complete len:373 (-),score=25.95 TRINITY_DN19223_c0_g2_i5:123-1241(-)
MAVSRAIAAIVGCLMLAGVAFVAVSPSTSSSPTDISVPSTDASATTMDAKLGHCSNHSDCTSNNCAGGNCCGLYVEDCVACGADGRCEACKDGFFLGVSGCTKPFGSGQICFEDEMCESGTCRGLPAYSTEKHCCATDVASSCPQCSSSGTCKLPPGGSCVHTSNCTSDSCEGSFCCSESTAAECSQCTETGDCSECNDGFYVLDGKCEPKLSPGEACNATNAACLSGACAGVTRNLTRCCRDDVEACLQCGSLGTCITDSLKPAGADCSSALDCSSGVCNEHSRCCGGYGCAACDMSGVCTQCDEVSFLTNGTSTCQPRIFNGNCTDDDKCLSGSCAGGACCSPGVNNCTQCDADGACTCLLYTSPSPRDS